VERQTEVKTDEAELAERTVGDQRGEVPEGGSEAEVAADAEDHVSFTRRGYKGRGLGDVRRKGLLYQYMFTPANALQRHRRVERIRGDDPNRFDDGINE
jgi:hypothetical protein